MKDKTTKMTSQWATLCNAFLVEAKWFASGQIPNADEYLKIGMVTSGVGVLFVHMFFLLGNGTNEGHYDLFNDNHGIISSVSKILRLWDDLGSARVRKLFNLHIHYVNDTLKFFERYVNVHN